MENFTPPKRPEPTWYDSDGAHYGPRPGAVAPASAAPAGPYPPTPQPPKPPPGAVPPMLARPAEPQPMAPQQYAQPAPMDPNDVQGAVAAGVVRRALMGTPGQLVRGQEQALIARDGLVRSEQAAPGMEQQYNEAKGEVAAAQNAGIDAQADYELEKSAVDAQRAQVMADREERDRDIRNEAELLRQQRHQTRVREVDTQMGQLSKVMDARLAEIQRNPRQERWANASTGERIMGILGVFAGGIAAGPGGENRALTHINQAIAEDIARNRATVDTLGEKASGIRYQLGEARRDWMNQDAADQADYAAQLVKTDSELASLEAVQSSEQGKARIASLRAALAEQTATKAKEAATMESQTRYAKTQDRVFGGRAGSLAEANKQAEMLAGKAGAPELLLSTLSGQPWRPAAPGARMSSEEKNAREVEEKSLSRQVRLPEFMGNETAYAPSAEQAKASNEVFSALDTIRRNNQEIRKMLAGGGGMTLTPTQLDRAKGLTKTNAALGGVTFHLGALAQGDHEIVQEISAAAAGDRWNIRDAQSALEGSTTIERNLSQSAARNLRTGPSSDAPYVTSGIKFERRD